MSLPDAPHKIAGGMAVGVAMLFLPIPIFGYPLAYFAAWLMGFNVIAALLTLILFKWAAPFFFALDVIVGSLLLTGKPVPLYLFTSNLEFASVNTWLTLGKTMGHPLLVGAIVNTIVVCTLVYFISRRVLQKKITLTQAGQGSRFIRK